MDVGFGGRYDDSLWLGVNSDYRYKSSVNIWRFKDPTFLEMINNLYFSPYIRPFCYYSYIYILSNAVLLHFINIDAIAL
jgi:hypothetical protein